MILSINMLSFTHKENYTVANGGRTRAYNYVNLAKIKLLSLTTQHESVR